ncbi:hypothetical protein PM082_020467 [Marasmius tenuissimus]|nr:hypothetical protein PM082_020467 [Marasmius tenuissimus]
MLLLQIDHRTETSIQAKARGCGLSCPVVKFRPPSSLEDRLEPEECVLEYINRYVYHHLQRSSHQQHTASTRATRQRKNPPSGPPQLQITLMTTQGVLIGGRCSL